MTNTTWMLRKWYLLIYTWRKHKVQHNVLNVYYGKVLYRGISSVSHSPLGAANSHVPGESPPCKAVWWEWGGQGAREGGVYHKRELQHTPEHWVSGQLAPTGSHSARVGIKATFIPMASTTRPQAAETFAPKVEGQDKQARPWSLFSALNLNALYPQYILLWNFKGIWFPASSSQQADSSGPMFSSSAFQSGRMNGLPVLLRLTPPVTHWLRSSLRFFVYHLS